MHHALMKRIHLLRLAVMLIAAMFAIPVRTESARPNLVIIMADDCTYNVQAPWRVSNDDKREDRRAVRWGHPPKPPA